jgi:ppGpp synthetase/RelA/SpoT-type nucleotidyltranferase
MAKAKALTKEERTAIDQMVAEYRARWVNLETFQGQLQALLINKKNALAPHVHSFKWRLKDPANLRAKLHRKFISAKAAGRVLDLTKDNMFVQINDLVGMRILHLYTGQMPAIDAAIKALLEEGGLNIIEGPFARTWDTETKSFFDDIGIETRESGSSMYTSVHYVVDSNSKTRYTAELQVRTLAEELWGEVTHVIDYPTPCASLACKEQIRVLARVASSCTRVVDAIFHTYEHFNASKKRARKRTTRHRQLSTKMKR